MWLCTNKAFLSMVDKAKAPGCLVVRARKPGHIQSLFPGAKVKRTVGSDYLFRAEIPRAEIAEAVAREIMGIDYYNFKDSVDDKALHDAFMGVWRVMSNIQTPPPYHQPSRNRQFSFSGA